MNIDRHVRRDVCAPLNDSTTPKYEHRIELFYSITKTHIFIGLVIFRLIIFYIEKNR